MPSLKAKIKTLNETIWEGRATDPKITEWLDNFALSSGAGLDERLHALFLLSNFMYFGDREIRGLLKAMYRDLYRYPIVEHVRRTNRDTLDSNVIDPLFTAQLGATRFLGVGNPSESGSHLSIIFDRRTAYLRICSYIRIRFSRAMAELVPLSFVTQPCRAIFSLTTSADRASRASSIQKIWWRTLRN